MDAVLRFLAENEPLVYILLGLAGLFAGRSLWRAWQEWQGAIFGLEREVALQRLRRSGMQLALLFLLAGAEFAFASFVFPTSNALSALATPTANVFVDPAAPPTIAASSEAQPSLPDETGCTPGQIEISQPTNGAQVEGVVTLVGTADVPNFGFYKFEVRSLGAEQWVTILAGRNPVRNGELGRWDTDTLLPGDYALRLVVTDTTGQSLPPCTITLRVGGLP